MTDLEEKAATVALESAEQFSQAGVMGLTLLACMGAISVLVWWLVTNAKSEKIALISVIDKQATDHKTVFDQHHEESMNLTEKINDTIKENTVTLEGLKERMGICQMKVQ